MSFSRSLLLVVGSWFRPVLDLSEQVVVRAGIPRQLQK